MKLKAEQLEQHCNKQLAPVYLISGDEHLLVQEASQTVRDIAKQQGFLERELFTADRSFDWQSLAATADSMSLFSDKKFIELSLHNGKPGDAGSKAIVAYTQNPPDDKILLIRSVKLDSSAQRSKWVKAVDAVGVNVTIWPLGTQQLPGWLRRRLQIVGFKPSTDAIRILAERTEGNLLAAQQEIDKLSLLYGDGELSAEQVQDAVASSSRYDIFNFVDSILQGDTDRGMRMLQGLQDESAEPTLILWALAREIRGLVKMSFSLQQGGNVANALNQHKVWDKRKPIVGAALQRHNYAAWCRLLQQTKHTDDTLKGIHRGDVWHELSRLCLAVANKKGVQLLGQPA